MSGESVRVACECCSFSVIERRTGDTCPGCGAEQCYLSEEHLGKTNDRDPYAALRNVLADALLQSSGGKGRERHALDGEAFEDQKIVQLAEWMGNGGFPIGQACKKAIESTRLPHEGARRELLGAIVYLAAEVVRLDRAQAKAAPLPPVGR